MSVHSDNARTFRNLERRAYEEGASTAVALAAELATAGGNYLLASLIEGITSEDYDHDAALAAIRKHTQAKR